MNNPPHIFVVYDGIENSVFDGQVVQPLISYRAQHPNTPITLISFEKKLRNSRYQHVADLLRMHQISLIIARKFPLISRISLSIASWQLRRVLSRLPQYTVTARGPIAGYICLHSIDRARCQSLTIQARGLLVEEYRHSTQNHHRIWSWYHAYKTKLLAHIERAAYASHAHIQAVSPALKHYVCATYATAPEHMSIATHDIPATIDLTTRALWRSQIRAFLQIAPDTHIYCYNGSIKSWQCPHQTVAYFMQQTEKNAQSFLLVLTHDVAPFQVLAQKAGLRTDQYQIMQVPHAQIYQFLAACDTGIVLREPSIINWTSRPTKILEYQAVGLKIAHNNTIAYLVE